MQPYRWLPLVLLTEAACWVPKDVGQQMQTEILALRGDVQSLKRDLDGAKATQSEQMQAALKKFEDLSHALEEYNQSSRTSDADFGTQLERMISDVQQLRGAVEVTDHRLGETESKLDQTLAARVQALQTQGANDTPDDGGGNALKDAPKGKKDLLAYGNKLAKDGKAADARLVYRSIVKQWPKESGITDEALFRIGEGYFDDKKYEDALREYVKVVDKFGNGNLVDDAYYKIGLCSMEMGNLEDAQTFFSEITANFKKSPLLKNAKAKLDEVQRRLEQDRRKKATKKK